MTNIPLNTVASIAGTVNAQREAALPKARQVHESARVDKYQQARERQHTEEVEDPAEDAVLAVRDGDPKSRGDGKHKKKPDVPEDVAEIHQEDGTITHVRSDGPSAINRLDISA